MPRRKKPSRNLYCRDGIWYARVVQADGRKARISTGLADEQAAAEWLRRRERDEQVAASAPPTAPPYSVVEALDHFTSVICATKKTKTKEMYELAARNLAEVLGLFDVNHLTRDDVQRYLNRRCEQAARSTVLKERITLKAALVAATERGLMTQLVDAVLPKFSFKYVPRRVFLREEDLPKLLAALPVHRAWWARVALFSGLRHQELESLEWEQDRGTYLDVRGTKTAGASRGLPVGRELRATLDEVPKGQRTGRIVEPWSNVNRDLGKACRAAGIERLTCHDLRRSFGSWLAQGGVSTRVIGELLGHAPGSKMADITYSFLTDRTLADAVDKLPRGTGRKAAGGTVSHVCSTRSQKGTQRRKKKGGSRSPRPQKP